MDDDDRVKMIGEIKNAWEKSGEEDKKLLEDMVKSFYLKP